MDMVLSTGILTPSQKDESRTYSENKVPPLENKFIHEHRYRTNFDKLAEIP